MPVATRFVLENHRARVALNWKLDRATTAGIVAGQNVPADSRIPLSPSLFSLQQLSERGR